MSGRLNGRNVKRSTEIKWTGEGGGGALGGGSAIEKLGLDGAKSVDGFRQV